MQNKITAKKKMMCLCLALLYMIFSANQVWAISDNPYWDFELSGINYIGGTHTEPYEMRLLNLEGTTAFCIQQDRDLASWGEYSYRKQDLAFYLGDSQERADHLAAIVWNGWGNSAKSNLDYALTQLAIWRFFGVPNLRLINYPNSEAELDKLLNSECISKNSVSFDVEDIALHKGENVELYDENAYLDKLMSLLKVPVGSEQLQENGKLSLTYMGNNRVKLKLNDHLPAQKGTISLNAEEKIKEAFEFVAFVSEDSQNMVSGELSPLIKKQYKLHLNVVEKPRLCQTDLSFKKLSDTVVSWETYVQEYKLESSGETKKEIVNIPVWAKRGVSGVSFSLQKVAATPDTESLAQGSDYVGQELKILGDPQTAISDNNGIVSFQALEPGTYMLKETKTLADLLPLKAAKIIRIEEEYSFTDELSIKLQTEDIDNERVKFSFSAYKELEPGAYARISTDKGDTVFALYTAEENNGLAANSIVEIIQAESKDGLIEPRTVLPAGSYYLKELSASSNYEISEELFPIVLANDEGGTPLQIRALGTGSYNKYRRHSLQLHKIDSESKAGIHEVGFSLEVQDENGSWVLIKDSSGAELKYSDEDGYIKWDDLQAGKFRLSEKATPSQYEAIGHSVELEINGLDTEHKLVLENKRRPISTTSITTTTVPSNTSSAHTVASVTTIKETSSTPQIPSTGEQDKTEQLRNLSVLFILLIAGACFIVRNFARFQTRFDEIGSERIDN